MLTTHRVIHAHGVINKQAGDSSLENITDAQIIVPWLGRILGFGEPQGDDGVGGGHQPAARAARPDRLQEVDDGGEDRAHRHCSTRRARRRRWRPRRPSAVAGGRRCAGGRVCAAAARRARRARCSRRLDARPDDRRAPSPAGPPSPPTTSRDTLPGSPSCVTRARSRPRSTRRRSRSSSTASERGDAGAGRPRRSPAPPPTVFGTRQVTPRGAARRRMERSGRSRSRTRRPAAVRSGEGVPMERFSRCWTPRRGVDRRWDPFVRRWRRRSSRRTRLRPDVLTADDL